MNHNCESYGFILSKIVKFLRKQKSKAYLALQALETDLTMLSQLQRCVFVKSFCMDVVKMDSKFIMRTCYSSINDPCNLVHKSPVGILQTRKGGK